MIPERILSRIAYEPMSGCWLWEGPITHDGYGQIWFEGRGRRVHRIFYAEKWGKIHPNKVLDHLCRVRCCVNPDHLEAVSYRENVLRGITVISHNYNKFQCDRGHPFSEANTYLTPNGRRQCKRCNAIRSLACYYRRKKNGCNA